MKICYIKVRFKKKNLKKNWFIKFLIFAKIVKKVENEYDNGFIHRLFIE